jgi:hypothetical protein
MSDVISLNKYKTQVVEKLLKEKVEEGEIEFNHVNDDFLAEHAKIEDISIEQLLQTVWMLAKRMDDLEFENLKFRLDIINLLNGGEVT